MALFDIEHPETGAIITVESEASPTQEEAESIIASVSTQQAPTPAPQTPEQQFVQQYIAQEQAPFLDQALSSGSRGLGMAYDLGKTAVEGVQGFGQILGDASTSGISDQRTVGQSIADLIARSIPGVGAIPAIRETAARALPNLAQTGVEAVGRLGVDLGTLISEAAKKAVQSPEALGNPIQAYIQSLMSRTPSQQEAEQVFAAQQQAQGEAVLADQPLVPEVIGEANVPLARAAPLLAPLPGMVAPAAALATKIASPITRVLSRGLTTPVIEKATGLLGLTESEGLTTLLEVAPARILEVQKGVVPKTGKSAVQAATKAENSLFDTTISSLEKGQREGLVMKGDRMLDKARSAVLEDFEYLNAQSPELQSALSKLTQLEGEISPVKGQKSLRKLNERYDSLIDKNSPEASAYRAARDELSNQLDDIYKAASGLNDSPYRDWGKVRQFKMGIQNKIDQTERAAGAAAVPVSAEAPGIGLIRTPGGALTRAIAGRVARAARPLIKQGIEFIDDATESVFKGSPKKVKAPALPDDVVASLKSQYSKSPPPVPSGPVASPSIPPSAATAPATTIEDLIKSYPPSLQKDPKLARIAAEAELRATSKAGKLEFKDPKTGANIQLLVTKNPSVGTSPKELPFRVSEIIEGKPFQHNTFNSMQEAWDYANKTKAGTYLAP